MSSSSSVAAAPTPTAKCNHSDGLAVRCQNEDNGCKSMICSYCYRVCESCGQRVCGACFAPCVFTSDATRKHSCLRCEETSVVCEVCNNLVCGGCCVSCIACKRLMCDDANDSNREPASRCSRVCDKTYPDGGACDAKVCKHCVGSDKLNDHHHPLRLMMCARTLQEQSCM